MAIKIDNLNKSNGIQYYDFTYDVTNKDFINDEFFNQILFVNKTKHSSINRNQLYYTCDGEVHSLFEWARTIMMCPQSISMSINDGFKMAQSMYRYVDSYYTWMCTEIYQDVIKIQISLRGTGNCSISLPDGTDYLSYFISYIQSIIGDDYYSDLFDKLDGGIMNITPSLNIDPGIVNGVFSALSFSLDIMLIPTNYRMAIDNVVADLILDGEIEGRMVRGKIQAREKVIFLYNNDILT